MNTSSCLSVLLVALAFPASAEEMLFECEFEAVRMGSIDPDAKAWLDDFSFRRRKFVYQTEPPKVVDGPDLGQSFWHEPRITVGKQEIEFEWRVGAKPLDRTPTISLSINRYSGKALESYSMLRSANQGPLEVNWARRGLCQIHKKKL